MTQSGVVLTHETCAALGKGDAICVNGRCWFVDEVAKSGEEDLRIILLCEGNQLVVFYKLTARGNRRFVHQNGLASYVLNTATARIFSKEART